MENKLTVSVVDGTGGGGMKHKTTAATATAQKNEQLGASELPFDDVKFVTLFQAVSPATQQLVFDALDMAVKSPALWKEYKAHTNENGGLMNPLELRCVIDGWKAATKRGVLV